VTVGHGATQGVCVHIREMLTKSGFKLTPAESKVVQVILNEYPTSGLGTATALARRAGVSDPTVIRLVTKIGFTGFAAFQAKLLEEVEAGLRSPLMMMEMKRPAVKGRNLTESYLHSVTEAVEATAVATIPQLYDRASETIMTAKGKVLVVGGRFSRFVAGMLASYLFQCRADVVSLGVLSAESFDGLLDLSGRDVLIVFDYRRYQRDVIQFAEQAAARGVQLILFTDPYHSPIAAKAKVVIVGRTEVNSPYDSLAPAVAQSEALIARLVAIDSLVSRSRVKDLEGIRTHNKITIEGPDGSSLASPKMRGRGPKRNVM